MPGPSEPRAERLEEPPNTTGPQVRSVIEGLQVDLDQMVEHLNELDEKVADLAVGYRHLRTHFLEDPYDDGATDAPVPEEGASRDDLTLPSVRRKVRAINSYLQKIISRAQRGVEDQHKVYDELMPDV